MASDGFGEPVPVAESSDGFGDPVPVGFRGAGASGSWDLPDPGLLQSLAVMFSGGATKKSFDEIAGRAAKLRLQATGNPTVRLVATPDGKHQYWDRYEANPQGGQKGPDDLANDVRGYVRGLDAAAEYNHPKLGFLANMAGEVGSDYALAGNRMIAPIYQGATGLYRGYFGNNSDDPMSKAASTTLGGLLGYGFARAPEALSAMSKTPLAQAIANSRVGQATGDATDYLGQKAGEAFSASGDRLKDLAGWLKINSLHPTPVLSEALADLPGGTVAAGREVLKRGSGGLTKAGTAEQLSAEFSKAGKAINELAQYHDAAGGAPINIRSAIAAGRAKAQELIDEPTTESVGKQMMGLVDKYDAKFASGTGTAEDILGMKRALGDAAYGENQKLARAGDTIAGKFGKGLSVFERATDDALDGALGPRFEAANLASRQLRGASQAAERSAARTQGNGLFDLKTWLTALAAGGAGHLGHVSTPEAAAAAGTAMLMQKYGAQAGARTLYGLGSGLQMAPRLGSFLAELSGYAPEAAPMLSGLPTTIGDLLEQRPRQAYSAPAFASGGRQ